MTPNPPPDDVDHWLTDFFQAQLPNPFPPAPTVAVAEPARPRRSTADHGRLTLAASVAALLGLGVTLSYGPNGGHAPADGPGLLEKSSANGPKELLKHMPKPDVPKLP
jgi:hypothetical protein